MGRQKVVSGLLGMVFGRLWVGVVSGFRIRERERCAGKEREEMSEMGWRVEGSGGLRVPENGVWVLWVEDRATRVREKKKTNAKKGGVYLSTEPVF